MKLFFAYARQKLPDMAVVCALFFFVAASSLLYGLPLASVGYAALLCLFIGGVSLAVGFRRFSRLHKQLTALAASRPLLLEGELPAPGSLSERDYQLILEALRRENARTASESSRRFRDMMEYYTLWAHQIKTPIAGMELILRRDETPENAELREQLFRIEQYADMVLGYLRLDSDQSDFVFARYDLDGIVRQALRKFAFQFVRRRLQLRYEDLNTQVLTDEKWLLFVLEQILSNALKYTPEGAISIYMEENETLVIRDTGIGIRPEDLPRVFDRGFTGFNGRAEKSSTGIGLYLCRRICGKLGHTIDITSAPGEGTAVHIGLASLPLETE